MDDRKISTNRLRFPVRTMLIIVTGVCLTFAFLSWMLPDDLPVEFSMCIYAGFGFCTAYALWSLCRVVTKPWKGPTDFIMVKVDVKWRRRLKSPLVIGPIATLTGVSTTFAPFYLLWCGPMEEFGVFEWITAPLCFLIIYLVPGFFMSLAGEVMAELMRSEKAPSDAESR